jgi:hypothetical protein
VLNEAGCSSGAESVVAGQSARIHHLTQELLKERQATATLKAKMAEQQRMLCKDLQVILLVLNGTPRVQRDRVVF